MSCPTPVLVSMSVEKTATVSGCCWRSRAKSAAAKASPQGMQCLTTRMPNRWAISVQRWANFPDSKTIAFPPAGPG